MSEEIPSPGTIVEDSENDSEAIVINTPSRTAEEWHVARDRTVADDNPEYPADDEVVVTLHWPAYERHVPLYSGGAIPLAELNERGIQYYAFPVSRLDVVGEIDAPTAPIKAIHPSPYHARTFDASKNRAFIESIRDAGEPPGPVMVRVLQQRPLKLELLNGHKRTWASSVAGLDEVPVWALYYVDDELAASFWAERHLEGYEPEHREVALDRLESQLGKSTAMDVVADATDKEAEPA